VSNWKKNELALSWGSMNVWTAGSGRSLVALHGLGGSGQYWHGLARHLVGWRLVAPDLAGFGRSDKPALRYNRSFHLETIKEVVAWTGETPVLLGHSVGAVLAALWAASRPDQISGLALVAALFPRRGLMPAPALRLAQGNPVARGRVAGGVFRTVWPAVSVAARLTRRFPSGLVSDYGRQSIGARADTMWTTLADLTVIEDLAALAGLSSNWPSLILGAADDRYVGPGDHDRWQSLLPTAEQVIVPAGGHQFLIRTGFEPLAAWIKGL
jgi:pimeloyl-ACP methyl ester carboxylesterase